MNRDIAIDYLRSSVTVLVVAHHAALAYTTFSHYDPEHYMQSTAPVVDSVRWMPLDLIISWNDMFFMALMFLISGLFVAPSIMRKGAGLFLSDRVKRLGIPYVIAVTLLAPLAYYPSWLSSNAVDQGNFLRGFFAPYVWTGGGLVPLSIACFLSSCGLHLPDDSQSDEEIILDCLIRQKSGCGFPGNQPADNNSRSPDCSA